MPDDLTDALTGALTGDPSPDQQAALARRVERARRASGRIRYGTVARVGVATVVLNPDSPLARANVASGLTGTPAQAQATLAALPRVFAEAGRAEALVAGSPASLPELPVVAEEAGYVAVEEGTDWVLTSPGRLLPGEPGDLVRPVAEQDEPAVAPLLAEGLDLPAGAVPGLARVIGHRLDDPRVAAWAVPADGRLAGVALTFAEDGLGLVEEVVVDPSRRRRGLGRALVSAAAGQLLVTGTRVVVAAADTGAAAERFWSGLGFSPVYETALYATRV